VLPTGSEDGDDRLPANQASRGDVDRVRASDLSHGERGELRGLVGELQEPLILAEDGLDLGALRRGPVGDEDLAAGVWMTTRDKVYPLYSQLTWRTMI
jgi:hypothetical protein